MIKKASWWKVPLVCLVLVASQRVVGQEKTVTADLTSVFFNTSKGGHAVGRHGAIYHTTNAGKSWQTEDSGTPVDLHSVNFVGPKMGWACGDVGTLVHTEDGGQTWTRVTWTDDVTDNLRRVTFIGPENGWICGDHGLLLHTEDGGKTWKPVPSGTRHNLEGMTWANSLEGWIVGGTTIVKGQQEDVILHTADGGIKWLTQATHATNDYLRDVCFPTARIGYAVGDTVLTTTDRGHTWTSAGPSMAHGPWYSVAFESPTHGWIGGAAGALFATTDGGKTWKRQPAGTGRDILSIFLYDNTEVAVCASSPDKTENGAAVLRTEDSGKNWLH